MDTQEKSQVWRFPKKYGELFRNISNDDIGVIIKGLFLGETDNLEGLNKAYYDIIKVDLDNLEKSAINGAKGANHGNKGGRPSKKTPQGILEKTPQGIENETPEVEEKKPLKERESKNERENESKSESKNETQSKGKIEINEQSLSLSYLGDNDFRDSLLENIRNKQTNKRAITEDLMLYFSAFDYQYNKSETYRSLREWIIELGRVNNKSAEELRHIFFSWYTYWTGQPKNKQPKDCKASLSKNPFLTQK